MADIKLREICHVCTNEDGDRFVGIKADAENVAVYFPVGYQLPGVTENERELRREITHLILVLGQFTNQKDKLLAMKKYFAPQSVDFPVNAYMTVITDFMSRNYYTETEQKFVTSNRSAGADWQKTSKKHRPLIQRNGSPIYQNYEVRSMTPNDRNMITRVHEFCVYEAFAKLGWLFSSEVPRKPQLKLDGNKQAFLTVVRDKLGQTFIDTDKRLFQSMIDMLNYLDEEKPASSYYFGTDNFEYVWEKLIDRAFGTQNKQDFFPRTYWRHLSSRGAVSRTNDALEPDTIMLPLDMGKAFVLDAKYYRYGLTGNPQHLPPSSSINKQITYGEYVNNHPMHTEYSAQDAVYNAFLLPYNGTAYDKETNPKGNPLGLTGHYESIGEAYGDWKTQGLSYEVVQGIVIDTKFLMHNYNNSVPQIKAMADIILRSYDRHRGLDRNLGTR